MGQGDRDLFVFLQAVEAVTIEAVTVLFLGRLSLNNNKTIRLYYGPQMGHNVSGRAQSITFVNNLSSIKS